MTAARTFSLTSFERTANCANCLNARDATRLGEDGLGANEEARPPADAREIYCSVWHALCTADTFCGAHRALPEFADQRPLAVLNSHRDRAGWWNRVGVLYWLALAGVITFSLPHLHVGP